MGAAPAFVFSDAAGEHLLLASGGWLPLRAAGWGLIEEEGVLTAGDLQEARRIVVDFLHVDNHVMAVPIRLARLAADYARELEGPPDEDVMEAIRRASPELHRVIRQPAWTCCDRLRNEEHHPECPQREASP